MSGFSDLGWPETPGEDTKCSEKPRSCCLASLPGEGPELGSEPWALPAEHLQGLLASLGLRPPRDKSGCKSVLVGLLCKLSKMVQIKGLGAADMQWVSRQCQFLFSGSRSWEDWLEPKPRKFRKSAI